MISDILSALDLLLTTVRGSPDFAKRKSRTKIARSLLRLYLDLEQLVSTGLQLLEEMESTQFFDRENWYDASAETIDKQLRKAYIDGQKKNVSLAYDKIVSLLGGQIKP
jgi:hypothetical protein